MVSINTDLRLLIEEKGVKFSDVASELGMHRTSFSRLLNNGDMRPSRKRAILEAIERASEKKNEG